MRSPLSPINLHLFSSIAGPLFHTVLIIHFLQGDSYILSFSNIFPIVNVRYSGAFEHNMKIHSINFDNLWWNNLCAPSRSLLEFLTRIHAKKTVALAKNSWQHISRDKDLYCGYNHQFLSYHKHLKNMNYSFWIANNINKTNKMMITQRMIMIYCWIILTKTITVLSQHHTMMINQLYINYSAF